MNIKLLIINLVVTSNGGVISEQNLTLTNSEKKEIPIYFYCRFYRL